MSNQLHVDSSIASHRYRIVVIGLGYVGLPLAVALARHFDVVGFDINDQRINELQNGYDRTGEVTETAVRDTTLRITNETSIIKNHDIYIVTVPTPITSDHQPDLEPLKNASTIVGKAITQNAIVVFESTVYPGVTEEICGPILEKHSGLICGKDFFLGYSPERVNPGDKQHTIETITKVIAGQTSIVTQKLAYIYGAINNNNIFIARDIKTAEAAKVIENTQRDINIAFINEITSIFSKMEISTHDVLDAASTKWNFLKFFPGLVGGHCISVDPYYLAHASKTVGHDPEVILAGRRINENMSNVIATAIHNVLQLKTHGDHAHILILGLTFKENVPDLRNTKVVDMISTLKQMGHDIDVHDPLADPQEVKQRYGIELISDLDEQDERCDYDCVISAVSHNEYRHFNSDIFSKLLRPGGLVADIKNIWRDVKLPNEITYWSL